MGVCARAYAFILANAQTCKCVQCNIALCRYIPFTLSLYFPSEDKYHKTSFNPRVELDI